MLFLNYFCLLLPVFCLLVFPKFLLPSGLILSLLPQMPPEPEDQLVESFSWKKDDLAVSFSCDEDDLAMYISFEDNDLAVSLCEKDDLVVFLSSDEDDLALEVFLFCAENDLAAVLWIRKILFFGFG